jgi:uncharacterized protein
MLHRFTQNGYNIALDVCSGAVHVLDKLSYELAAFVDENMSKEPPVSAVSELSQNYGKAEIDEAWAELYELFKAGVLCSKDDYERYCNSDAKAPIKSLCLNVAHDCNLRCKYCFASTGDFGGGRKLMPFEVGKAALDFLVENSAKRHNLEVDFFGGEPLMNFDVVKRLVEYGRSIEKEHGKHFRFTLTTNGILLDDDKIDFINREMHNIVLSIDGRREVNDAMRPHVDGRGSYDEIIEKYKKLVVRRNGGEYYVRGTYTHKNLDFAADVLHLADEGFDQISVEPVVSDGSSPYALQVKDLPQIFDEYEKLAKAFIERKNKGRGFNFFHFMLDLDGGPCILKLLRGCGCGNEYVAVTPEGDIYPCHQFVGQDGMIMGNVLKETGTFTNELKTSFSKANIFTKQGCSECWARYFCTGGCNANNQLYCGDMLKPLKITCELQKKRLECALMIKAALAENQEV